MRTLTLAAGVLLLGASASAKYYEADHYDVALRLDSQGTLDVTETVVFHFVAGPFTFVFRDIAATETDGITNISALMDGVPCAIGKAPGEVEITGSSPVKVRWHFAELINGTHTFTVQYRAVGVMRRTDNAQTLIWRVLPRDRGYRIASSRIILDYPAGVTPQSVTLNSHLGVEVGNGRAVALIDPGLKEDLILDASFANGSFIGPDPEWPVARERKAQDLLLGERYGALTALVLLVLACLWMFRLRASVASDSTELGSLTVTSLPNAMPPALAGCLAGKAGVGLSLGTLLDLARRGVVRIEETQRSRWRGPQFQLVLLDRLAAGLAPHERALLDLTFHGGESNLPMHSFASRQATGGTFATSVRDEVKAAGLIDDARSRVRSRLLAVGLVGLAVGLALFITGVAGLSSSIAFWAAIGLGTGAAAVLAGLLALILAGTLPIWSRPGLIAAAEWKAFARYLTQVARGREPFPLEMDRVLPYAVAFGLGTPLLQRQKKEGGVELPAWFQAFDSNDGSDSTAFMVFVSSCDSTASSSDGGSGGGDGGGASGGGSSGAG